MCLPKSYDEVQAGATLAPASRSERRRYDTARAVARNMRGHVHPEFAAKQLEATGVAKATCVLVCAILKEQR